MKLRQSWDTMRTALEELELPPYLVKAVRWVEKHPRAVAAASLVVLLAVALSQTPVEKPVEPDAYNGETPLFV